MQIMQQMFGNNPMFGRAVEMTKGKNQAEIQDTVKNLCQQRGLDFDQLVSMFKGANK